MLKYMKRRWSIKARARDFNEVNIDQNLIFAEQQKMERGNILSEFRE